MSADHTQAIAAANQPLHKYATLSELHIIKNLIESCKETAEDYDVRICLDIAHDSIKDALKVVVAR